MNSAPPLLAGWVTALRGLLFGFDYFISYSQEPASRAYGSSLQGALATRDYVSFRDETHLEVGSRLSLRIRIALRRTRCLIVLGTVRAMGSEWVAREIRLFSARRRPIIPVDLESIRDRHPWHVLQDVKFLEDRLPEPSARAIDEICGAFKGWRANRIARIALVALSLAATVAATAILWQASSLRVRAERLRNTSIVGIARTLGDPLVRGLVLLEIDREHLARDSKARALVRETARQPVPVAVLRATGETVQAMGFSPDGQWLATVDRGKVVWLWPTDGRGDPKKLGELPWIADRLTFSRDGGAVLCAGSRDAAVLTLTGEARVFESYEPPAAEDRNHADSSFDEESVPAGRWFASHWATAWRLAPDGRSVVEMPDSGGLRLLPAAATDDREPFAVLDLEGRAVLDTWIDPSSSGDRITGQALCVDGALFELEIACGGRRTTRFVRDLVADPAAWLDLGEDPDATAFFADGGLVVAALGESGLLIADLGDVAPPRIYAPAEPIARWTADDTGQRLLVTLENDDVKVVDLTDLAELEQPPDTRVRYWTAIEYALGGPSGPAEVASERVGFPRPALAPGGRLAALVTQSRAWLWSIDGGRPLADLRPGFYFETGVRPSFSRDGGMLAIADALEVRIWRTDGQRLEPAGVILPDRAYELAVHDSGVFLVGTVGGDLFLGDTGTAESLRPLAKGLGERVACAVGPQGRAGVAVFSEGTVSAWELPSGKQIDGHRYPPPRRDVPAYLDVTFLGADRVLLSGGEVPVVWTLGGEVEPWPIPVAGSDAQVAVASEAGLVFTADDRRRLACWRPDSEVPIFEIPIPAEGVVWDLAASADGRYLVAGLSDGVVLVWEPLAPSRSTWTFRVSGQEASENVMAVAVRPGGSELAVGTEFGRVGVGRLADRSITRWLVAPGNEQAAVGSESQIAHLGVVADLHFSPDGSRLVSSGGMDGVVHVWSPERGHLARFVVGIATVSLFDGSRRLAILSESGELTFWWVEATDLLDRFRAWTTTSLLPAERVRYLGETAQAARERYEEEERRLGRTPLPPDYADIDFGPW